MRGMHRVALLRRIIQLEAIYPILNPIPEIAPPPPQYRVKLQRHPVTPGQLFKSYILSIALTSAIQRPL